jgi:hypothetical protein
MTDDSQILMIPIQLPEDADPDVRPVEVLWSDGTVTTVDNVQHDMPHIDDKHIAPVTEADIASWTPTDADLEAWTT